MTKDDMIAEMRTKLFEVDEMRKWIGRVKRRKLAENKSTELSVKGLGSVSQLDVLISGTDVKIKHDDLREVLVWVRSCEHSINDINEIRNYHPLDMWERMFLIGAMDDLREVIDIKKRMNVFMRLIRERPSFVTIKRIKEHDETSIA